MLPSVGYLTSNAQAAGSVIIMKAELPRQEYSVRTLRTILTKTSAACKVVPEAAEAGILCDDFANDLNDDVSSVHSSSGICRVPARHSSRRGHCTRRQQSHVDISQSAVLRSNQSVRWRKRHLRKPVHALPDQESQLNFKRSEDSA